MGGTHYFVLRRWADICNIAALYYEEAPKFTLSQPTTVLKVHIVVLVFGLISIDLCSGVKY